MLTLAQDNWRIEVSHLTALDGAPVWRCFRDSDKAALLALLVPVPAYPHAAELQAALDGLVEQASHIAPAAASHARPARRKLAA